MTERRMRNGRQENARHRTEAQAAAELRLSRTEDFVAETG